MTRADGRAFDQLRPVEMTPGFTKFAEGFNEVVEFIRRTKGIPEPEK